MSSLVGVNSITTELAHQKVYNLHSKVDRLTPDGFMFGCPIPGMKSPA